MIYRPTGSYQLDLPDAISQQIDERVVSFWVDEQPLLLQLSSYQRKVGETISAEQRLRDRIDRTPSEWTNLYTKLCQDPGVDQAFAKQRDGETVWLHGYLVWLHLTVYLTISGPEQDVSNPDSWALNAVKTLTISLQ